jgi:predicted ATPase
MAQLLGIRIQNYRALRDVELGKAAWSAGVELPRLVCLIGPNGSGKSSLLDAFGFLADCLREGIEAACDKPHRGGFERLRTQGAQGPMEFHLYFREAPTALPISYDLTIDMQDGRPIATSEVLRQRRKGERHGRPYPVLKLAEGSGHVWPGDSTGGDDAATKIAVALDDPTRLGITTLGQLKDHPRIVGLRAYIEGWYLSYFVPDAARTLPPSGAQRHLDRTGANLGNYLQFLRRTHPERFQAVLDAVGQKIPGIQSISCEDSPDRRLLIQFNESGYSDPFFQSSMSDGTLKLFAYLLLLQDPEPYPLIGIEEPENGLYHRLLRTLAEEFLDHARGDRETQLFITTHAPAFVDALAPEQVWLMQKLQDGGVSIERTADIPTVKALYAQGIPLGSLWFSRHLQERGFGGT